MERLPLSCNLENENDLMDNKIRSTGHLDAFLRTNGQAEAAAIAERFFDYQHIFLHSPRLEMAGIHAGCAVAACLKISLSDELPLVAGLGWIQEVCTAIITAKTDPIRACPVPVAEGTGNQVLRPGFLQDIPRLDQRYLPFTGTAPRVIGIEHQADIHA